VLDEHNTSRDVYADKGYPSARRSEMLQVLGWRAYPAQGPEEQAPERMPEEAQHAHCQDPCPSGAPFAQMRHMGGKLIRTIGQVRAAVAMTMMAACYNLKRLARFLEDGVDAFYKGGPSKSEVRLQGINA
jgi:IS5 family transposase